jgi:menaquinone-dependent protoporphyrinogen oxidase
MSRKNQLNRRDFLKAAGLTLGASALVCGGLGTFVTLPPPVDYPETHAAKAGSLPRMLVAYASKAGSTAEVAKVIGEIGSMQGMAVDVLKIQHIQDINSYQAVILGSAIRMGQVLPEVVEFIKTHQAELSQKPVAYFVNCLTMKEDTPENRRTVMEYLQPLRTLLEPLSLGLFSGKIDYSKLSWMDRLIMANFVKAPEGDYRQWDLIRTWAAQALPSI